MRCEICPTGALKNYKFVVVLSRLGGKWLLSKHRRRSTWETQGGHIETGEMPLEAARRELWEESGAAEYTIRPLCDYWASDETSRANGMAFYAEITRLGELPESEMERVGVFAALPENLTYPSITPKLVSYLLSVERARGCAAGAPD